MPNKMFEIVTKNSALTGLQNNSVFTLGNCRHSKMSTSKMFGCKSRPKTSTKNQNKYYPYQGKQIHKVNSSTSSLTHTKNIKI